MPGRIDAHLGHKDAPHPYWPVGAVVRGYEPNETPLWLLVAAFVAMLAIAISTGLFLARRANPMLSRSDTALLGWFILCSLTAWPGAGKTGFPRTELADKAKQAAGCIASLKVCRWPHEQR